MTCWCYETAFRILLSKRIFGFWATEPGYAVNIDALEIWFIDWLIDNEIDIFNLQNGQRAWYRVDNVCIVTM